MSSKDHEGLTDWNLICCKAQDELPHENESEDRGSL